MRADQEYIVERIAVEDRGYFTKCWVWQLSPCSGQGDHRYGGACRNGRTLRAHCLSYETFVGPIPDGFHIDHLCRVTMCVNPNHLEAVSPRENCLRGFGPAAMNFRKTACVKGHPFTAENTKILANGRRQCLACLKLRRNSVKKPRRAPSHCPNGHEFTPENTAVHCDPRRPGVFRRCRTCRRAQYAIDNQKRRGAVDAMTGVGVGDTQSINRRLKSANATHDGCPVHHKGRNT